MTTTSFHSNGAPPLNARAAVELYLKRKLAPIPLPPRSKVPNYADWQHLRITPETLDDYFPPQEFRNVGILNGEPSGNVLDVDLDCLEARLSAPLLLPETGWIFGRRSAHGSHRIYKVDRPLNTAQEAFTDLDNAVLVELRGSGGLTVYPPSLHQETGEQISWEHFGDLAEVKLEDLQTSVRALGAATLLARHWPAKGSRDAAAMALHGALARAGWDQERVSCFVFAVAVGAGDEEARMRASKGKRTFEKLQEGAPVLGWPKLSELVGDAVTACVRNWLGIPQKQRASTGRSGQSSHYRPIPEFKPFPVDALPVGLRELVEVASRSLRCEPSLVALHALVTAAGAIGNSRALLLKQGWIEPCVLWGVSVAYSGTLKSPAFKVATGVLSEIQMDLFDKHKEKMEEHKEAIRSWKAVPKDERSAEPETPADPLIFLTGDTTIEALGVMLEANPKGVLIAREEVDAWFNSFSKYRNGGGSDRAQWLELHSAGTLRVDRLTREKRHLAVRHAAASVCGTIQPGTLLKALDPDALQAGVGARFLLTMPPRQRRVWTEDELPDDVVDKYRKLLLTLLALPLTDPCRRKAHVLRLSGDAKCLWVSFFNEWGGVQLNAEGEQASAFAKLEAYAARLALVHHVVSHVTAGVDDVCSVTAASMQAGITLARWFAGEAVRVYALLRESDEERQTRELVEWIARQEGRRTTVRLLQKSNARRWRSKEVAEAALEDLASQGLGHWEEAPPSGHGGHYPKWFVLSDKTSDTSDACFEEGEAAFDTASDTRSDACSETSKQDDNEPNANGFHESSWVNACDQGADQASEVSDVLRNGENGFHHANERERVSEGSEQASDNSSKNSVFVSKAVGKSVGPSMYLLVKDQEALHTVAAAIDNTVRVGLDVETTGLNPRTDRIRLLSLACDTIDGGTFAYLVDCFAVDPTPLWETLEDKDLLGHNLIFDLGFLHQLGFTPSGRVFDLMHLSRVLHAGEDFAIKHTLQAVAERHLGQVLDKTEQTSNWSGGLTESQLRYAAKDVLVLAPLLDKLQVKLHDVNLEKTAEIETRCLPATVWMSTRGVAVDRDRWLALADKVEAEAADLKRQMAEQAPIRLGEMFSAWNWDSPADMLVLFCDTLGFKIDSTGDDVLAKIDHPLAGLLRRYREATKRTSSYGRDWVHHIQEDGRVYAKWNQTGAGSGRMSCGEPNLQQLPRSKDYRSCLTAPPGRVLIKADYSQIELRIAAKVSGDQAMLEAYQRKDDLHTMTARSVLGVQEVTKQDRQLAKAVNFGLLYGMGAKGFRQYTQANYGVDLTEQEATQYREAFFRSYPGIRAWHRRIGRTKDQAIETRTLAGRRRLGVSRFTEKLNTPVQGTGADGLKLALALLWERRDQVPGAFPVLAVHDEIVVEADADQADAAAAWLKTATIDAMAPLIDPVPVDVEVKIARTWGGN